MALTFSTGVVDAVAFLGLDHVFVGNMTGNVVLLGMALGGGPNLSVVTALAAFAGFILGTALGGRALRGAEPGWPPRVGALLGVVATLLALVGVVLSVVDARTGAPVAAVTATLGLAMGLQAAAARHVAEPDVSTVAITNTLIGLGFDSPLGRGRSGRRTLQAAVVALIVLGAVTGALLLRLDAVAGIALATAVVAAAALAGRDAAPRRGASAG